MRDSSATYIHTHVTHLLDSGVRWPLCDSGVIKRLFAVVHLN